MNLPTAPAEFQKFGCKTPYLKYENGKYYPFPCNQCIYCRQQKANAWRLRLELEFTDWEKSSFLTLTYKELNPFDENFKKSRSLDYTDCQYFMKKARQHIKRKMNDKKIKFFVAGEYGKQSTQRAHWHYLIFGLDGNETEEIAKKWDFGINDTQEVCGIEGVARYVSSYVLDKIDLNTNEYYEKHKRTPPLHRGSQGLGLNSAMRYFLKDFKTQWEHYMKTGEKLPLVWQGREVFLPRYLRNKICETHGILEEVKQDGLNKLGEKIEDAVYLWKTLGTGEIHKDTPKGKYDKPYTYKDGYTYEIMREAWNFVYGVKIRNKEKKFKQYELDKLMKSVI